ncbi:MAG TPA: hypothetical protein VFP65_12925 [Anaeromyxobacteraceae bacterium]|nr:hypothetical protein [Anaeromyxobacteraceae bacterium]
MNGLAAFLALLAAAYVGAALIGGQRGRGLASGSEWLLLGFAAGPAGLGLVGQEVVDAFRQLSTVGVGWVALVIGLEYGFVGERRIGWRTLVLANLAALATAALVAAAAGWVLGLATPGAGFLRRREDLVVALGAAAALSDTARDAFRWAARRALPDGPLRLLLAEVADADDLVPVALTALAFALAPDGSATLGAPLARLGAEAGLGVALGAIAAVLASASGRRTAILGVLFGTSLTALGLAARLGLSGLGAGFLLGLVLHVASRHGAELRDLSVEMERPIVLPALLLAGATVDPGAHPAILTLASLAVGARLLAKLCVGATLAVFSPVARRGGWATAPAMLASAPLAPVIGLAFALRFPGAAGQAVLACACASAVVGELASAPAIRAALRNAGELSPAGDVEASARAEARP